jgi:hypothetical protein
MNTLLNAFRDLLTHSVLTVLCLLAALLFPFSAGARVFVATNSTWRYFKGTSEGSTPTNAWRELDFHDSAWPIGTAPFHFGTNGVGGDDKLIEGTILSDMRSNYTCLFLRQRFVLPDTNNVRGLWLNAWIDDGLAVWINGQVARNPLSVGGVAYTNTATASREGSTRAPLTLATAISLLRPGTNVLCIQAFNRTLTDDDFRIDVELAETPATFDLATNSYAVREDATQLVVRVVRSGALDAGMSVDYATTNGTALAGLDYEAASGTLVFGEGQAEQPITVPVFNDTAVEGTETFQIVLSNAQGGATLGTASTTTVRITELITSQPVSLAALLGSNVTFRVTAAGTAPITYQWRLDGRDLVGATNATLVLSNVTLADLGGYTALVRDAAGEATTQPAWLKLARWVELVFFGASEGLPMCATGPWTAQLANQLGVLLRNYAVAGANDSAVRSQIANYLASYTPTTNILFSLWVGGSEDALAGSPARAASNRLDHVRALALRGARSFLIPRMGPLAQTPYVHVNYPQISNEVALQYDALLDQGLEALQAQYAVTLFRPDMFAWMTAILENPALYGFRVPPDADVWCDGLHFTSAVHRLASQFMCNVIDPPLVATLRSETTGGMVHLYWQGGSPPFRVQHCEDPASGLWQSDELTFQTNATTSHSAPHQFFRILQLGQ